MNRPITAKTALLKISMLFLIPFFLFMFGLNVYSNTIYRQRLTENNQTRLTMFESFLEEDGSSLPHRQDPYCPFSGRKAWP